MGVLERLAEFTESRQALQQQIRNALIYPIALVVTAVGLLGLSLPFDADAYFASVSRSVVLEAHEDLTGEFPVTQFGTVTLPKGKAERAVPAYRAALAAEPSMVAVGGHSFGGRVAIAGARGTALDFNIDGSPDRSISDGHHVDTDHRLDHLAGHALSHVARAHEADAPDACAEPPPESRRISSARSSCAARC